MPHQSDVRVFLHIIFHVHESCPGIPTDLENDVHAFMTQIAEDERRRHDVIAVGGVPSHVHILLQLHPEQSISYLVRDIKSYSTRFIREHPNGNASFSWQGGYGAYSMRARELPVCIKYIKRQRLHHGLE